MWFRSKEETAERKAAREKAVMIARLMGDKEKAVLTAFDRDPEEAFELAKMFLNGDAKWSNTDEFVRLVLKSRFGRWVNEVKFKRKEPK